MQKTPLGMNEETWEHRNENHLYKTEHFKKGFKAGRKASKKKEFVENPYTLSSDIWKLLQKRTRWYLGFEEGWAAGKAKSRRDGREQLKHIKEITKKKKHHKHKKHHHE